MPPISQSQLRLKSAQQRVLGSPELLALIFSFLAHYRYRPDGPCFCGCGATSCAFSPVYESGDEDENEECYNVVSQLEGTWSLDTAAATGLASPRSRKKKPSIGPRNKPSYNFANALVCRTWSSPALDVLWRVVDHPERVFALLEGGAFNGTGDSSLRSGNDGDLRRNHTLKLVDHGNGVWGPKNWGAGVSDYDKRQHSRPQEENADEEDEAWKVYTFNRAPTPASWRRFDRYANRVRHLVYVRPCLDADALRDIGLTRSRVAIFPRLLSLTWAHNPLSWAALFMHAGVRRFSVDVGLWGVERVVSSLSAEPRSEVGRERTVSTTITTTITTHLSHVAQRMPDLEHLVVASSMAPPVWMWEEGLAGIFVAEESADDEDGSAATVHLSHLRTLTLPPFASTPRVIRAVSLLPMLERVECRHPAFSWTHSTEEDDDQEDWERVLWSASDHTAWKSLQHTAVLFPSLQDVNLDMAYTDAAALFSGLQHISDAVPPSLSRALTIRGQTPAQSEPVIALAQLKSVRISSPLLDTPRAMHALFRALGCAERCKDLERVAVRSVATDARVGGAEFWDAWRSVRRGRAAASREDGAARGSRWVKGLQGESEDEEWSDSDDDDDSGSSGSRSRSRRSHSPISSPTQPEPEERHEGDSKPFSTSTLSAKGGSFAVSDITNYDGHDPGDDLDHQYPFHHNRPRTPSPPPTNPQPIARGEVSASAAGDDEVDEVFDAVEVERAIALFSDGPEEYDVGPTDLHGDDGSDNGDDGGVPDAPIEEQKEGEDEEDEDEDTPWSPGGDDTYAPSRTRITLYTLAPLLGLGVGRSWGSSLPLKSLEIRHHLPLLLTHTDVARIATALRHTIERMSLGVGVALCAGYEVGRAGLSYSTNEKTRGGSGVLDEDTQGEGVCEHGTSAEASESGGRRGGHEPPGTTLTLAALLPFAAHCPRLTHLGLFLDASVGVDGLLSLLSPEEPGSGSTFDANTSSEPPPTKFPPGSINSQIRAFASRYLVDSVDGTPSPAGSFPQFRHLKVLELGASVVEVPVGMVVEQVRAAVRGASADKTRSDMKTSLAKIKRDFRRVVARHNDTRRRLDEAAVQPGKAEEDGGESEEDPFCGVYDDSMDAFLEYAMWTRARLGLDVEDAQDLAGYGDEDVGSDEETTVAALEAAINDRSASIEMHAVQRQAVFISHLLPSPSSNTSTYDADAAFMALLQRSTRANSGSQSQSQSQYLALPAPPTSNVPSTHQSQPVKAVARTPTPIHSTQTFTILPGLPPPPPSALSAAEYASSPPPSALSSLLAARHSAWLKLNELLPMLLYMRERERHHARRVLRENAELRMRCGVMGDVIRVGMHNLAGGGAGGAMGMGGGAKLRLRVTHHHVDGGDHVGGQRRVWAVEGGGGGDGDGDGDASVSRGGKGRRGGVFDRLQGWWGAL